MWDAALRQGLVLITSLLFYVYPACLFIHELAVSNAFRLFQSEAFRFVGLVVGVGAFEIEDIAITFEGEDFSKNVQLPICVETKGPLPIEFEHGYVAFEDLPDNRRRLPGEKPSGILGMLGLDEDDDDDEDLDDDEDSDEDSDDDLEEEDVIYDENE